MQAGAYRRSSELDEVRDTTRLIRAECKGCGCVFRIARKWFTPGVPMDCPVPLCRGYVCTELDA